jgi:hypothetical protein
MYTPSIKLTEREILLAASSGVQREVECLRKLESGKNATSNYERTCNSVGPGGLWNNHIEGALGEFAVAKYLGLYPGAITGEAETDVGEFYEVRTRPKTYQELFVKKKDKPDKYYILVQGSFGDYTLIGWISGFEVFDHPEWFHNNSGKLSYQYWVPHKNLYSIETLPKEAPCPKITSSQNLLTSTKIIQFNSLEKF